MRSEHVVLEANPDYWDTTRLPRVQRIIFDNTLAQHDAEEFVETSEGRVDVWTKGRDDPTHVPVTFQKKAGHIVLDQIRTVDKRRCIRRLGSIDQRTAAKVLQALQEMFAP